MIIMLLFLAGVTIAMITGENGITIEDVAQGETAESQL